MQFDQIKRREFITLLGVAAAAWPLGARAQQESKPPTIGFMGSTTAAAWTPYVAAFEERLRELGWIKGRTVAIDYRWGEGRSERFAEIAAKFVRRKVDVIVTSGTAAAAAMHATSVIPIVLAVANDPVGSGMVASLARPGGNVTGLSLQAPDLVGKRLELLREVRPDLRAVAIMASTYPAALSEMDDVAAAARTLGIETRRLEVRRADDIAAAMATFAGSAQALYVCADGMLNTNRDRIIALAQDARLATMSGYKEFVEAGSLMSYGPSYPDLFRRAGDYVNKILRGAKPGELPVEQPIKFELVLNQKAAKVLGIEFPDKLLALADEVIE
jgi:putative ABC transport system substrate-binding protein